MLVPFVPLMTTGGSAWLPFMDAAVSTEMPAFRTSEDRDVMLFESAAVVRVSVTTEDCSAVVV